MKSRSLFTFSLMSLALASWGCDDDDDDVVLPEPTLRISAANACGGSYLPVISGNSVADNEKMTLVIKGRDQRTSTGYMLDDTTIVVEKHEAASTSGSGEVVFWSTRQAVLEGRDTIDNMAGHSQDLLISEGETSDQIYCTKEGVVTLIARTEPAYQAGGTEKANIYESRKLSLKCVSPEDYKKVCSSGADASTDDSGSSEHDAGGTDIVLAPWTIANVAASSADDLIIGTRGGTSGYPNSVALTFLVEDTSGPLKDVEVEFTLPENSPPQLILEPSKSTTNEKGLAQVRLYAGGSPGIVSITATANYNDLEQTARSEAIVIRGGTPSMRSFDFSCEDRIVPAFTTRLSDGSWLLNEREGTSCTVQLADRVQGRIDTATQVFFLSEAGNMDETVATDEDGRASSIMRIGLPAPVDIAPAGPSPKDGLVRVVAITRGEEDFIDADGNKIYEEGVDEFIPALHDLSDPFVDANDNGVRDCNADLCEEFRDADRSPGQEAKFSEPNGVWDGDTEIWKSTLVLWVGDVLVEEMGNDEASYIQMACAGGKCSTSSPINPNCADGLPFYTHTGGMINVSAYFVDVNGNCPDGYHKGVVAISVPGDYEVSGDAVSMNYSRRPFNSSSLNHGKFEIPCFVDREENPQVSPANWTVVDVGNPPEIDEQGNEVFQNASNGHIDVMLSYENAFEDSITYTFSTAVCR